MHNCQTVNCTKFSRSSVHASSTADLDGLHRPTVIAWTNRFNHSLVVVL